MSASSPAYSRPASDQSDALAPWGRGLHLATAERRGIGDSDRHTRSRDERPRRATGYASRGL